MSADKLSDKVGIILLNWNTYNDTINCINGLRKGPLFDNFTIYLIDNGSKNGEGMKLTELYKGLEYVKVYVNNVNHGFTGGCNQGIEYALLDGCDYVMLLNNDSEIPSKSMQGILDFFADKHVGIVGPTILNLDGTIQSVGGKVIPYLGTCKLLHKGGEYKQLDVGGNKEVDFVSGACMIIKNKVLEDVGFLDDDYFAYYEEVDLCLRAKKSGWKTLACSKYCISHSSGNSTGGNQHLSHIQSYFRGRNGIIFGRKNYFGIRKLVYFVGFFTIKQSITMIKSIRSIQVFKSYIRGLKDGLIGSSRTRFILELS